MKVELDIQAKEALSPQDLKEMRHNNVVRQPGPNNDWNEVIDYGPHEIMIACIKTPLSKTDSSRYYSGPYCKFCNQILFGKEPEDG